MKLIYKPPDSGNWGPPHVGPNACLVGYAEPAGPYGWLDYAHWSEMNTSRGNARRTNDRPLWKNMQYGLFS